MSIEQTDVIDFQGTLPESGKVRLTIADHLEWGDERHFDLLSRKLNVYIHYLENQMPSQFPQLAGRQVEIHLGCKYQPDSESVAVLESFRKTLSDLGIEFFWRVSKWHEDLQD